MANSNDQFLGRHVQVPFRHDSGVSPHPLQRAGAVPLDSHGMWPRTFAGGVPGLMDAPYAAPYTDLSLPPVVPLIGSPRDPRFMVS